jgi:hypothetical protein
MRSDPRGIQIMKQQMRFGSEGPSRHLKLDGMPSIDRLVLTSCGLVLRSCEI